MPVCCIASPAVAIVPVDVDRPPHRVPQIVHAVVVKREAAHAVEDGVRESARRANDGHRPIAHRDHLSEAARLEERGHQEDVAAAVDERRQLTVVSEHRRHLVAMVLRQVSQHRLVVLRARTQHDHLGVACVPVQQKVQRVAEDVEALSVRRASTPSRQAARHPAGEGRRVPAAHACSHCGDPASGCRRARRDADLFAGL